MLRERETCCVKNSCNSPLAHRMAYLQENWSLEHQLREERRRSEALAAQNATMEDALLHADMEAKELHR
jgi:hypothetical protein